MKTLVWTAAERMEWKEADMPVPAPGEVLVRVEAVGVCGSEIEGYLGHNSLRVPPLVMGHEFCGTIADASAAFGRWEAGQKVVANPLLYCGSCARCRKGLTMLCDRRQIIGVHRPGAFAEYVAVPEAAIVSVPDDLPPLRAALAEPLACSLRAARRALRDQPFANVLVFGAGGIGLLSAMVADRLGAGGILIADTNDDRLRMAGTLGAFHTVNPRSEPLGEKIGSAFGGDGIDVVIDAAGFQPTREAAMRLLNPGGTFMNIGLGVDDTVLPINHLIRSEIQVLGSFCYTREDFRHAVGLLASGAITERGWTETRPLREGGQAFADLVAGSVHYGKIVLQPDGGDVHA